MATNKKEILQLNDLIKMRVEQLENKNQFVIYYKNNYTEIVVFQSYRTIIAIYYPYEKELFINWHYWDYSKTTSKHLKIFINDYTIYKYDNKKQFLDFITSDNMVKLFEE